MFPGAPTATNISAPLQLPLVQLTDYGGGSVVLYQGWARSVQLTVATLPTVSSFTAASPGVITFASAHGFNWISGAPAIVTMQPIIGISGGTGNWAAANGMWIFQPTGTTTGTIASIVSGSLTQLNTTTFGAVTGTLVVSTRAPQTFNPVWAIKAHVYNGSSAELFNGWVGNPIGAGSGVSERVVGCSASFNFIWDNRASLAYG